MRFLTFLLFTVTILAFIGIGQELYYNDNTVNIYDHSDNFTEELYSKLHMNITEPSEEIELRNADRFTNVIAHIFNAGTGIMIEFAGWGVEYGYNHYWWDAFFIAKAMLYLMIAMLIAKLIIPAIVLGYLIYLLVKWIQKKIKARRKRHTSVKK